MVTGQVGGLILRCEKILDCESICYTCHESPQYNLSNFEFCSITKIGAKFVSAQSSLLYAYARISPGSLATSLLEMRITIKNYYYFDHNTPWDKPSCHHSHVKQTYKRITWFWYNLLRITTFLSRTIAQDFICFWYFFEFGFRFILVVGIFVWMPLESHTPVPMNHAKWVTTQTES